MSHSLGQCRGTLKALDIDEGAYVRAVIENGMYSEWFMLVFDQRMDVLSAVMLFLQADGSLDGYAPIKQSGMPAYARLYHATGERVYDVPVVPAGGNSDGIRFASYMLRESDTLNLRFRPEGLALI